MLSNDPELEAGWRWCREPWRKLPELIIQDAIDKHFDTEQANFLRSNEPRKIMPRVYIP